MINYTKTVYRFAVNVKKINKKILIQPVGFLRDLLAK